MSADSAIARYLVLRDEVLPAIPSRGGIEFTLEPVPNAACKNPRCGKRGWPKHLSTVSGREWRCGRCLNPWRTRSVVETVSSPKRSGAPKEGAMSRVHQIERHLRSLSLWERRVLIAKGQFDRLLSTINNLRPNEERMIPILREWSWAMGNAPKWERKVVGSVWAGIREDPNRCDATGWVLEGFSRCFPRAKEGWDLRRVRRLLASARRQYERDPHAEQTKRRMDVHIPGSKAMGCL